MTIRTYQAFLITLGALLAGFVWATFKPAAPYEAFSAAVSGVFLGYGYKRLKQKEAKYQPSGNGNGVGEEGQLGHE